MMQTLLTDRFEMKHHRTSKEFPVYGLVVAKGGLKIAEIAAAEDATEAAKKPVEVSATGQPRWPDCELWKWICLFVRRQQVPG